MKPVHKTETPELVIRMMNDFVANDYLEEGVWEFLKFVQSTRAMRTSGMKHFVLIAEMEEQIIGTIEVRDNNHITLFFVEKKYSQRGVGRKLLQRALELCKNNNPELSEITVNSLPGSVYIYESLGFHAERHAPGEGDAPCTPMFLLLSKAHHIQAPFYDEMNETPRGFLSMIRETPTYILYDG
jgi:GNAT superfamily N-acetyltransferase